MKKNIVIITLLFISIAVFGQNVNHIKFRDIAVDGELSQFVSKLKNIGYSLESTTKDNASILKGTFLGKKGDLFVISSPKTKTVWKVAFYFREDDSWKSLKYDYESLKEQLTKKYGEPESFEFFSNPYYEGDGYETQALKKDKCTFVSYYITKIGSIKLEISSFCQILISYEDKINSENSAKEEDEKIQDEI
jgi:hypothetical protein